MKEQAIFKLYTKYPFLDCTKSTETENVVLCMPSEDFVDKYCKDECDCCNGNTIIKEKEEMEKEITIGGIFIEIYVIKILFFNCCSKI